MLYTQNEYLKDLENETNSIQNISENKRKEFEELIKP